MKKFLLIGVAALLATVTSFAQNGQPYTDYQTVGLPVTFYTGTTNYANSNAPTIGAIHQRYVSIQTVLIAGSAGATNQFILSPSIDGSTYSANNTQIWSNSITGAGTNVNSFTFDSQGFAYYKLTSVVTTGQATNGYPTSTNWSATVLPFIYGNKISSP